MLSAIITIFALHPLLCYFTHGNIFHQNWEPCRAKGPPVTDLDIFQSGGMELFIATKRRCSHREEGKRKSKCGNEATFTPFCLASGSASNQLRSQPPPAGWGPGLTGKEVQSICWGRRCCLQLIHEEKGLLRDRQRDWVPTSTPLLKPTRFWGESLADKALPLS